MKAHDVRPSHPGQVLRAVDARPAAAALAPAHRLGPALEQRVGRRGEAVLANPNPSPSPNPNPNPNQVKQYWRGRLGCAPYNASAVELPAEDRDCYDAAFLWWSLPLIVVLAEALFALVVPSP